MPEPIASRQPRATTSFSAPTHHVEEPSTGTARTRLHTTPRGSSAADGVRELTWIERLLGPLRAGGTGPSADRPASTTPLSPEARELRELGASTRSKHPERAWPEDAPLREGRNAHHSNTAEEMRDALTADDDYNWLEGDLRVDDDGTLVMAHDADKEGAGLDLKEWLAIGGSAQRGMKVDVKENDAIPKLLDALEASGIPNGRIMLNVGAGVSIEQLREMRERFPDAWLALDPSATEAGYPDDHLQRVIDAADELGGRIAFPIRWDLADQELIDQLEPHGDVSIWTSKSQGTPDDTEQEIKRLRERGVEGVIDLGAPSSLVEKAHQRLNDLWESGPSRGAREVAGDVKDGAVNGAKGALEVVKDAPGAVRDVAKKAPIIGGLFD